MRLSTECLEHRIALPYHLLYCSIPYQLCPLFQQRMATFGAGSVVTQGYYRASAHGFACLTTSPVPFLLPPPSSTSVLVCEKNLWTHLESLYPRLCSGRFVLYLELRKAYGREAAMRKCLEIVGFQKCVFQIKIKVGGFLTRFSRKWWPQNTKTMVASSFGAESGGWSCWKVGSCEVGAHKHKILWTSINSIFKFSFKILWILIYIWVFCLHICLCTIRMLSDWKAEEDMFPGTGVINGYEPPCACWEPNLGPR